MKCREENQEVTEGCGNTDWKLERTALEINRRLES